MRKTRKFLSMFLASVMLLSTSSSTIYAESLINDEEGSTITDAIQSDYGTPSETAIMSESACHKNIYHGTYTLVANDTTHWFVGADIQRVYLTGTPGGVICVTDTEH